ncbi:dihydrolipoyl dehydrogenase family protein [Nigerium massiliense]|uniref:dihydrolipoyl dehydrogenase family protein n=1 Tax=Nigerium massiliense TaxID=1522317 RepID=UPI00058FF8E2|nr:NAD(P)/FAD-dependent oxidoreductase [Nigerium massiliense]
MDSYDIVVIGGGPVGENAADYAIRGSDRTALLVEAGLLGGECSYYACMPSKALLRPLDVAETANHLPGIRPDVTVDRDALLARRDDWVSHYDDAGQISWAEGAGIEVARGRGRLAGEKLVEITAADGGVRQVEARLAVVIATGSTPIIPSSLEPVLPWTSRDATGVREVPKRLAIVGGGVVACESARWLAALGAEVTMLVRSERVLADAEEFASEAVAQGLREAGVDVRLNTEVTQATREDARDTGLGRPHGGPVTLTIGEETVQVDEVLAATGRRPATDDLGLDTLALGPEDLDDPEQRPSWLHTVGDASGDAPLTHWGKYRARQFGKELAARCEGRELPPTPAFVPVPQVVFSSPQLAFVGKTERRAKALGRRVRVLDADYGAVAGTALLRDDAAGHVRLVVDADTDVLLGATFLGPDVAELLHSATVAITGGLTLDTLQHAVASYPTAAEVWLNLLENQ